MAKRKIEIEIDVPDDFEATGEYRGPIRGESWIATDGSLFSDPDYAPTRNPRIILRRKTPATTIEILESNTSGLMPFRGDGVAKRDPEKLYLRESESGHGWLLSGGNGTDMAFDPGVSYVELPPILSPEPPKLTQVPGWTVEIEEAMKSYWWVASNVHAGIEMKDCLLTAAEAIADWNAFAEKFRGCVPRTLERRRKYASRFASTTARMPPAAFTHGTTKQ